MYRLFLLFTALFSFFSSSAQEGKILKAGKVSRAVTYAGGEYTIPVKEGKQVLVIQGRDMVIDFSNARLRGNAGNSLPDQYQGTAIIIRKSRNVTLKNLEISGFASAIVVENSLGIQLENLKIRNNFRNRLPSGSTAGKPKTGAALVFINAADCSISNSVVSGNEMIAEIRNSGSIHLLNNEFSFNSGGVVLNASHGSNILFNRINNIGNGSSSAAIVLKGNSHSNIIYKNSMIYCEAAIRNDADAGRDSAKANVIMENDLSFATEAGYLGSGTNVVIERNRIFESGTGLRLQFPALVRIGNNQFRNNLYGISSTGGELLVHHNVFLADSTAISISGKTRKAGNNKASLVSIANSFNRNRVVYRIDNLDSVSEFSNLYSGYDTLFRADESLLNMEAEERDDQLIQLSEEYQPRLIAATQLLNPFGGWSRPGGRKKLVLSEYGPFNYAYPMVLARKDSADLVILELAGPEGWYEVESTEGLDFVKQNGQQQWIFRRKDDAVAGTVLFRYRGGALTTGEDRNVAEGGVFLFGTVTR